MTFVTISDAGGPGSARRNGCQGAWLVAAAEAAIRSNQKARVSVLAWRSTRFKRAISSTIAAETLSLSGALAEAQWMQILFRDCVFGDVRGPDWHLTTGPYSVVLSRDCELSQACESLAVVDAKSVFDMLFKNTGGSKADRRNTIELSIVRDSMSRLGSRIRWVLHGRMPSDCMTKADPARGSVALTELLRRGTLVLID